MEEEKRAKEFVERFPRFSRVPVFGWIGKWGYKEGYKTLLILCWLLGLTFFLRYYNLWYVQPFDDEYTHLANVRFLYEWIEIRDTRGMFINHLIKYIYDFVGYDIFDYANSYETALYYARLPWVILSVIIAFFFYLIWKELWDKRLALLIVFWFAISALSIEMAKFIREYIYILFTLIIAVYLLLKIDREKLFTWYNIAWWIYISLLLYFSLFIDRQSTFKIVLFFIVCYVLCYMLFNFRIILKYYKYFLALTIIVIIAWFIFADNFLSSLLYHIWFSPHYRWSQTFITNDNFHWNWFNPILYLPVILIAISIIYFYINKHIRFAYMYSLILFVFFVIFYTYFFDRYFQIRYAFFVYLPMIILIWVWVYTIWQYIWKWRFIVLLLLSLTIFNPNTLLHTLNWNHHATWNRITWHFIEDIQYIYNKLNHQINDEDILIWSLVNPIYINFWWDRNRYVGYSYRDENRFIETKEVILSNNSWYMILDYKRHGWWSEWFPRENFFVEDIEVEYLGRHQRIDIYKWYRD